MPTPAEEYRSILSQNLINLLGLELLPEEKKLALLEQAQELVLKRVMLRAIEELKEEDGPALEAAEAEGKAMDFLVERVPNLPEMIFEETARVKIELMDAKGEVLP